MKILDKYVAKNFLIGYVIVLMVMMGLIIVVDLFVNLDEFAEPPKHISQEGEVITVEDGPIQVLSRIFIFYTAQSALYFRECAGFITVTAAVFSLGRMTKNNELIAIMASGVSLKRVIAPIIILSTLLTGLLIIDQELIIPRLANKLVRTHDSITGSQAYSVWFMEDSKGSRICTGHYDEGTATMTDLAIIIREKISAKKWKTKGRIKADRAVYDYQNKGWRLKNGRYDEISSDIQNNEMQFKPEPRTFYISDLTPEIVPLKRQESFLELLSLKQLSALEKGARTKDLASLIAQKQNRITDPIINIIMLLVALPVLVCRDPKSMKTAILKSFLITASCFAVTFICKMVATEVIFNQIRPEIWAWLPVMIFLPIAFIEIDSMRT